MSSGGGSGGSGTQKFEWNDSIAPYWQEQLANARTGLFEKPYEQYQGQRIAGLTQDQQDAMNNTRHFINSPEQFLYGKGNQEYQSTLAGDYMPGGDKANPYAGVANQYSTMGNLHSGDSNEYAGMVNPWQNTTAGIIDNKYKGDNPYFRSVVEQGMGDIGKSYTQATDANLQRFKGSNRNSSAFDQANTNAADALARNLARYQGEMASGQYDRSANLEENAINRDLQDQQFDKQLGGNWYQDMLGRATSTRENQINRQVAGDESTLNRAFQGEESRLGRGMTGYEAERGRMMGAAGASQADQALTLQRYQAQMGIGDVNRSYNQDLLNQGYSNWQDQQQYPYKQIDWMTGLLSRAQGGMSPNMTSTQSGYAASPYAGLLGAGLAAYGLMR